MSSIGKDGKKEKDIFARNDGTEDHSGKTILQKIEKKEQRKK